jgi:hypothetical protein
VQVIHGIILPPARLFARWNASRQQRVRGVLDVVIASGTSSTGFRSVDVEQHRHHEDGSRVLVGIRTDAGVVDVIDTASRAGESIPVNGSVHNVFVTPTEVCSKRFDREQSRNRD